MAAVVLQWSKDSDGKAKANFSNHGTVSKVSATGPMEKNIELFSDEKDKTYYWYKGKVSGDKMTLAMFNRGGEEVTKKIELQLVFF
ncbi:hypothetical protein N7533_013238 [Penicillium manginii]|uniref:uncharacterized protein n=1 Tax=Penicillium manginii TaxID=203109 RepID=UPI0025474C75|nr:uncharacterized protein N7533_013238 [Penicillium manginii]KAJ5734835.1 hypothetical protein N7533_013238 [Penicillium manginii]